MTRLRPLWSLDRENATELLFDLCGQLNAGNHLWIIGQPPASCLTLCQECDTGSIEAPAVFAVLSISFERDGFVVPAAFIRIGPDVLPKELALLCQTQPMSSLNGTPPSC